MTEGHASHLLAIDTAQDCVSVALLPADIAPSAADAVDPIAHETLAMDRGHAAVLMPMIDRVLSGAGAVHGDVGAVGVCAGPGSFTGIRVGLATARGLALARGIPAFGVSAFAVYRQAARDSSGPKVAAAATVVLETKRQDYFVEPSGGSAMALSGDALSQALLERPAPLIGDGVRRLLEAFPALSDHVSAKPDGLSGRPPDAREVARLALHAWKNDSADVAATIASPPRPIYIHPPAVRRPAS